MYKSKSTKKCKIERKTKWDTKRLDFWNLINKHEDDKLNYYIYYKGNGDPRFDEKNKSVEIKMTGMMIIHLR